MARSTVFGWMAAYREGGLEALWARPVPGRRPKLSGVQLGRLYALVSATTLGSCGSRSRCGPVTWSAS
jgi:transposase